VRDHCSAHVSKVLGPREPLAATAALPFRV
jgi:hypothetical protein